MTIGMPRHAIPLVLIPMLFSLSCVSTSNKPRQDTARAGLVAHQGEALRQRLSAWLRCKNYTGTTAVYDDPEARDIFVIEDHVRSTLLSLASDADCGPKASLILKAFYPDLRLKQDDGRTTLSDETVRPDWPWPNPPQEDLDKAIQQALRPLGGIIRDELRPASIQITESRSGKRAIVLVGYGNRQVLSELLYYMVFSKGKRGWLLCAMGHRGGS